MTIQRFIIVDDLYANYTVVVDIADRTTSVYCERCEDWVFHLDGEQVTRHTRLDFFELITDVHRKQVVGETINFK